MHRPSGEPGALASANTGARTLLAGVVHEVRNPVFAMTATLDALAQRLGDRGDLTSHLRVLRRELARLSALTAELNELGTPIGPLVPTPVRELLLAAVAAGQRTAAERDVTVVARLASDLGSVAADVPRLAGVTVRLLDFAVCRTPAGGNVQLLAHRTAGDAAELVRCTIKDGGPGLAPEALREVLLPFTVRRAGLLSLDLAIAAAVLGDHGGGLRVENEERGGLRYVLELPVGLTREAPARGSPGG